MKLLTCLILPLVAWCAPATMVKDDTFPDESLKPLIRTKRAQEEIVFGNHQNNAHIVKKSDPSLPLDNEEAVIDNNPSAETKIKEANTQADDVINSVGDDMVHEKSDLPMTDMVMDGEAAEAGEENGFGKEEEQSSGDMDAQNEVYGPDGSLIATDTNGYYGYDYYYPYLGMPRPRPRTVMKRSAPQKLLTAENMALDDPSPARIKRDLAADDIYKWLENGAEPQDYYYPEYENVEPVENNNQRDNEALNSLMNEYAEIQESPKSLDYPVYEDYESTPNDVGNTKDLLSLLAYLVDSEEQQEESPLSDLYPEDIQEEWQDLGTADAEEEQTIQYEPIVYNGVPGIFIPVEQEQEVSKRQFLSMVPGNKKRSFYPYREEPEGQWGAFVPEMEEEKRTAEAYDRLYRMAQALNPPEEEQYFGYK